MAQIPGLPTTEPVALPKASPGQFGSVGETIAGLGQETEQMAQANMQFEGHLFAAQNYLKAKQAEIAFDSRRNQLYTDLAKATTPEDAQATWDHAKGELNSVLTPFETNKSLARQLALYRQQQEVEIQNNVNAKKADIITKSDHTANKVLFDSSTQEAINIRMGGGNDSGVKAAFDAKTQSSVHVIGSMFPQEQAAVMQSWEKTVEAGVLDAKANSPNPLVRRQLIEQLKSGKGPVDTSKLDRGEINKFLTHAEETDKRLTALGEVQDFNSDIHNLKQTFNAAPYTNGDGTPNLANRHSALDDDKFLLEHGIVTKDPTTGAMIPDYVRAEKASGYFNAEARDSNIAAKKTADDIRDQALLMMATGHIGQGMQFAVKHIHELQAAGTDYFPQIISAGKGWEAEGRSEAREGRDEQRFQWSKDRQDTEDRGYQTMMGLQERIDKGEVINNGELVNKAIHKEMSFAQAAKIQQDASHSSQDADYANGLAIINAAAGTDLKAGAELQDKYRKAVKEQHLTGKQAIDKAKEITEDHSENKLYKMFKSIGTSFGLLTPDASTTTPAAMTAPTGGKDYGDAGGKPDGSTGALPDGTRVIVRHGRLVKQ